MDAISERLQAVHAAIDAAAARSGRSPRDVELVAVSKTHPPDLVREAVEAGQFVFGESRVQEARAKIPLISGRARWHFIGHLQRNKIRQALPLFELLHGIDSLELARDLAQAASDIGARPAILLEVNVAGESSKFGFKPAHLREQCESLLQLQRLQIEGLMTIPPLAPQPEHTRRHFAALRELRDDLARICGVSLSQLSMGMSGDFGVAIEEGATLVRVGTAIFGNRGRSWRPPSVAEDSFS